MKISDIALNKSNPRKISKSAMEKLKVSIERDPEFMVLRPIVIDKNGLIIGGNQRFKAIKLLGMKDIPDSWVVRACDLTTEQIKRFVLIDNSPDGMSGHWDEHLLEGFVDMQVLADLGFEQYESVLDSEPLFYPGTEDDQGQLDVLDPEIVNCPACHKSFDLRKKTNNDH